MDALLVAKVVGVTSSGVFAGYTWSQSDSALPGVLDAPEDALCRQWRYQYLRGFYVAIVSTPVNILCWSYLAYHANTEFTRRMLGIAAVTTGSGTVLAWTLLRGLNGALCIRAAKIAGPGDKPHHVALNYSRDEDWAKRLEKKHSTRELVSQWVRLNLWRGVVLGLGTLTGAVALALD